MPSSTKGWEMGCDRQVVARPQWLPAQRREVEGGLRRPLPTAPATCGRMHGQPLRLGHRHHPPGRLKARSNAASARPSAGTCQVGMAAQPGPRGKSLPALQHQHVQVLFDQRDEGQEGVAPRLAAEQIVRRRCSRWRPRPRRARTGRLNRRPRIMASDDVVDLELVETQQPAAFTAMSSASGGTGSAPPGLGLLPGEYPGVDVLHEGVKWMRCLRATCASAKNKSINIDLPRPTSPTR